MSMTLTVLQSANENITYLAGLGGDEQGEGAQGVEGHFISSYKEPLATQFKPEHGTGCYPTCRRERGNPNASAPIAPCTSWYSP